MKKFNEDFYTSTNKYNPSYHDKIKHLYQFFQESNKYEYMKEHPEIWQIFHSTYNLYPNISLPNGTFIQVVPPTSPTPLVFSSGYFLNGQFAFSITVNFSTFPANEQAYVGLANQPNLNQGFISTPNLYITQQVSTGNFTLVQDNVSTVIGNQNANNVVISWVCSGPTSYGYNISGIGSPTQWTYINYTSILANYIFIGSLATDNVTFTLGPVPGPLTSFIY
jgi:hypothetical protein